MEFPHTKFRAYQLALDAVEVSFLSVTNLPTGFACLAEQMRRAALSIPLNIAEGAGRKTKTDRMRYYSIARGSAAECAAMFDVLERLRLVEADRCHDGRKILHAIVSILTTTIQKASALV